MEWQPIETCPSDKLVIVACDTYDCGWMYHIATRDPKLKMYDDKDGSLFYEWPSNNTQVKMHTPPSHWMPLPNPPKEAK